MGMGLLHHEYVSLCGYSYILVIQGLTRLHFDSTLWKMTIWQFQNNYYLGRSMYEMDMTNKPYASSALTRQKIPILSNFFSIWNIRSKVDPNTEVVVIFDWKVVESENENEPLGYIWSNLTSNDLLSLQRNLRWTWCGNVNCARISRNNSLTNRGTKVRGTLWHSNMMTSRRRFPYHWPFVRGIHRSPVDSPHKGPVMQSFDLKIG